MNSFDPDRKVHGALERFEAPVWYEIRSSRVVRITSLGTIKPYGSTGLSAEEIIGALAQQHGIEEVESSIGEALRRQVSRYFPSEYTVFVRIDLPKAWSNARVTFWIATPYLKWSSALIARQSWRLLVPVLLHQISPIFEQAFQGATIEIDQRSVRVNAFAPRRLLTEPVILIALSALITSLVWLYFHPPLWIRLGFS
jgi:hypothetical protein